MIKASNTSDSNVGFYIVTRFDGQVFVRSYFKISNIEIYWSIYKASSKFRNTVSFRF